ncbi:MAG: ThiF family adenylyltransferase [Verrucomicrobia bacterium]|nr:ThiF family adenylyltransferase [Verrucomicrobiota bacterium]MCH8528713.1 ThiF family adenylyltransferase [Kiritimatiellia bacterium]
MNSFSLSDNPLNIGGFLKDFANDRAGARVSFEGVVRNHHLGQGVDFLEYEAFPEMVEAEGGRILTEARERFALTDAAAVHRAGRLEIGDVAVWVGALAEHRQEAFLACQWIMDQIKARLPVWKKEHFSNGTVEWVGAGLQEPGLTPRAEAYYQRQCVLPQLGPAGQEKLGRARVLVAGAGGLGCPALLYLAAAGAGQLSVIDGDTVNLSNLHRQILFTPADLGKGKASVAAERLRAQNPWIAVQAHDGFLDTDWLAQHLNGHDLVLDCTDHFPTRYLLHDACWRAGIPLVQAAIHQFEGQVQSFHPDSPGGCLRCLWPEPPSADCAGTCAEAGVLGLTAGQVGLQQAMEALRLLLDWPGHLLEHTLLIDLMSGATRRIRRQVRPGCVCRTGAFPAPAPMPAPAPAWLSPGDSLPSGARYVDIREAYERENAPADILALPHFPRERWEAIPGEIRQRPLILCCAAGVRTRHCLELLGHPPGIWAWTGSIHDRPAAKESLPQ